MRTPEVTNQLPHHQAAAFLSASSPPLLVLPLGLADPTRRMREEVEAGLSSEVQRWIPPTYFYDQAGSELYEAITALPEYYPTRTEAALLATIAPLLSRELGTPEIIELGSGSSTKTRVLFDAFASAGKAATYVPIDISPAMLTDSAHRLIGEYPGMRILGLVGDYEDALSTLPSGRDRLVLFLGGTIGNFPPDVQATFFGRLAELMEPGQHLLLGFDRRAHALKSPHIIQAAYDDAQGVTARFNLNVLRHINRALGADFQLDHWRHRALYNEQDHQIEMYLESKQAQEVHIHALDRRFRFEKGERVLTELSRKFDPDELADWFGERGFPCVRHWSDAAGYFGLMLLRRDG